MPEPTSYGEPIWLQPHPDVLFDGSPDEAPAPEARCETKDGRARFERDTARRTIPTAFAASWPKISTTGPPYRQRCLGTVVSDLNAKLTAERLYVHPNNARCRLAKIEERAGYDLRPVADVIDLVIAVRVGG